MNGNQIISWPPIGAREWGWSRGRGQAECAERCRRRAQRARERLGRLLSLGAATKAAGRVTFLARSSRPKASQARLTGFSLTECAASLPLTWPPRRAPAARRLAGSQAHRLPTSQPASQLDSRQFWASETTRGVEQDEQEDVARLSP